jgi:hypothetical protein
MAQVVSCQPLTTEARFMPGSLCVGFVVDKVALGQVFLQALQFSHHHSVMALHAYISHISPGGCTIYPLVATDQRYRLTPST